MSTTFIRKILRICANGGYMKESFEKKYFCAANSGEGFVNFYPYLNEIAERVFVIKGGPGTGKSSFMRCVAREAERKGKSVTYYYCSSDPGSLDAVFINNRILLLDGTAPHTAELSLPGAKDDIIDLGAFWDCAVLIGQRKRIMSLSKEKSECFSSAYAYLSAAKSASEAQSILLSKALLREKLESCAKRTMKKLPCGDRFFEKKIFTKSYGMRGAVAFDTLSKIADERITVYDVYNSAHIFLSEIYNEAKRKKMCVVSSCDPLIPSRFDALYLPESGILFTVGNDGDKNINMRRFIDPEVLKAQKSCLKQASDLISSAESCALDCFGRAAKYHFELEKIYGEAMDFAAKEEFTDNFISEMFD